MTDFGIQDRTHDDNEQIESLDENLPNNMEVEPELNADSAPTTHILELPNHCLIKIFEKLAIFYLPLVQETCERFNALANYIFKKNHAGNFDISAHVYIDDYRLKKILYGFGPLVRRLRIKDMIDSKMYTPIALKYCMNLQELYLLSTSLNELCYATNQLTALEKITIEECSGAAKHISTLLKQSPNLKDFMLKTSIRRSWDRKDNANKYTTITNVGDSSIGYYEQFIRDHFKRNNFSIDFEYDQTRGFHIVSFYWKSV